MGEREIFFEREDLLDFCTPETIDRLIIVTHNTEVLAIIHQRTGKSVLGRIGVLIFVDQQIVISFLPASPQIVIRFQQLHWQVDQIIKVDRIETPHSFLVAQIGSCLDFLIVIHCTVQCGFRCDKIHLPAGNTGTDAIDIPFGGIQSADLPQDLHQDSPRIRVIVNREARSHSTRPVLLAQKLQAKTVEGRQQRAGIQIGVHALQALPHLFCGLVRKGETQNPVPLHRPPGHQVRHAIGDHTGFASPCTREDQKGAFAELDGFQLLLIQDRQIETHVPPAADPSRKVHLRRGLPGKKRYPRLSLHSERAWTNAPQGFSTSGSRRRCRLSRLHRTSGPIPHSCQRRSRRNFHLALRQSGKCRRTADS